MGGTFVYIVGRYYNDKGAIEIIDVCATRKKAQAEIENSIPDDDREGVRIWCWQVDGGEVKNEGAL